MKKFAAFLMILSLGVFSIGCGGGADTSPAPETGGDTAETPGAADGEEGGAAAGGEEGGAAAGGEEGGAAGEGDGAAPAGGEAGSEAP